MSTPLHTIATTSTAVAATRSRKRKVEALTGCLAGVDEDEIGVVASWLTGVLPQGRIGLGPAILRDVADECASDTATLTVASVQQAIEDIAATAGKGSLLRRRDRLGQLMRAATHDEQAFLLKLLLGDLRQGALEGVMTEAIAAAANASSAAVRRAVMVSGDIAAVARAALKDGEAGLETFRMRVGTPLQPMLAQTADNVVDALRAFRRAAFEYKLDGARVQVHRNGDDVRIFTRRLNDVTERLPEIVEIVKLLSGEELILDGEVIALRKDGRPHPFQVTMRRFGRRLEVEAMRARLPLSVYFFDLLYSSGDVSDQPASTRFQTMNEVLPPELIVPRIVTTDARLAQQHLDSALDAGHEGIMAKSLSAPYDAGNRGAGWLKIKPTHSLDLVVLAAEWGSGRRKGWLSNLHLGAYDPDTGGFVMLGKTFKGLTDDMLQWQTDKLLGLEQRREGAVVYVQPELVVEIAFNELQTSRQYPGGLALRFARVKGYREDKRPDQADTIGTVRAIADAGHTGSVDQDPTL